MLTEPVWSRSASDKDTPTAASRQACRMYMQTGLGSVECQTDVHSGRISGVRTCSGERANPVTGMEVEHSSLVHSYRRFKVSILNLLFFNEPLVKSLASLFGFY